MRFLSFILAVLTALTLFGATCTDSVSVGFRVGHRQFDPSLGNNREVMDGFVSKVREAALRGDLERIVVYGYASPDGQPRANERLARNRCATIAGYIASRAGVSPELIEERPEGIGWAELRRLVESTPEVPHRLKVLSILDNTPLQIFNRSGQIVDGRKKQLMDLAGGRSWNWMYAHLFPRLRNAVGISLYCCNDAASALPGADLNAAKAAAEERTEMPMDIIEAGPTWEADVAELTALAEQTLAEKATETPGAAMAGGSGIAPADSAGAYKPFHRFAVKTNMLFYAILMPNLELEWMIDRRWSVALEADIAWWGSYKKEKSYRVAVFDAEVRRWIKPREPWHGFYVGLIAGGGYYDIENGTPGRYGEGLLTGLSAGYMWPIGRNLSLEAEIGAGYLYTRYKEYEPYEGHHVYLRTKDLNYFGPIKLKFSIAWRFFDTNKPKPAAPGGL